MIYLYSTFGIEPPYSYRKAVAQAAASSHGTMSSCREMWCVLADRLTFSLSGGERTSQLSTCRHLLTTRTVRLDICNHSDSRAELERMNKVAGARGQSGATIELYSPLV